LAKLIAKSGNTFEGISLQDLQNQALKNGQQLFVSQNQKLLFAKKIRISDSDSQQKNGDFCSSMSLQDKFRHQHQA